MISDNSKPSLMLCIAQSGSLSKQIKHWNKQVCFINTNFILHYLTHSLKSHSRINIMLCKLGEISLFISIKFHKHIVPDFKPIILICFYIWSNRWKFWLPHSIKNFSVWSTRAHRTRTPPIIIRVKKRDSLIRDSCISPCLCSKFISRSILISLKNRYCKLSRIKTQMLYQKFITPLNRLLLKISSETPVSHHFKKRQVRIIPHFINIYRSYTLLNIEKLLPKRMRFPCKIGN